MTDYPLLILPPPEVHDKRSKRQPPRFNLRFPTRGRQQARIGPRLAVLDRQFRARFVELRTEATGAEPEEVIVLEIVGAVDDFAKAVRRVDGLEWLGELIEVEIEADEDFYEAHKKTGDPTDKVMSGRLFLIFSNNTALQQILGLWKSYQQGQTLPHGYTKWRDVFERLRDIRLWGVKDRISETGVLEEWRERVRFAGEVRCEIELWHRQNPDRMTAALSRVEQLVRDLGGAVRTRCSLPEIAYHAVVAELRRDAIARLLEHPETAADIDLLRSEDVQFVRPVGQIVGPTHDLGTAEEIAYAPSRPSGEPVVALLDGVPLQNHQALAEHLIVDDPDGFEEFYPANRRSHGTAMASIIVHGELPGTNPIERPLYVRPVMQPHPWGNDELVPDDHLVVDLIHRAVRRIKEGDGGEPAAAPQVCIINLSICDAGRPFHFAMSPLARLLDWLAWRHDVLFVVSAGNHLEPLTVAMQLDEFIQLEPDDQRDEILKAVARHQRLRRLLSPAETVNGLCVGAAHSDSTEAPAPTGHIDPLDTHQLPSPISAVGLGYRRGIKPDLLAVGGRCPLEPEEADDGSTMLRPYRGILAPGVRVASPSSRPGDTNSTVFSRGTSVACAITSHWASKLHDAIMQLRSEHASAIDRIPRALWIKALLVHSTVWADGYSAVETALKDGNNSHKMREIAARFLGYGELWPSRGLSCLPTRATALASGLIIADEKRTHRFPLPPSLSGQREWKRLTITLSWFTPVNPFHQAWRRADLWFEAATDALKIQRNGADHHAVRRGTLQHEVYEGERAAVFVDGDAIVIDVNCKPGAGNLEEQIPYALAVSLEVADGVKVPVYEEVGARIRPRVPVTARS